MASPTRPDSGKVRTFSGSWPHLCCATISNTGRWAPVAMWPRFNLHMHRSARPVEHWQQRLLKAPQIRSPCVCRFSMAASTKVGTGGVREKMMTEIRSMAVYQWRLEDPPFLQWLISVLPFFDGVISWEFGPGIDDRPVDPALKILIGHGLLERTRPCDLLTANAARQIAELLQFGERYGLGLDDTDGLLSWEKRNSYSSPPLAGLLDWDISYARRYVKPPTVSDETVHLAHDIWPLVECHLPASLRDINETLARQPFTWSSISSIFPQLAQDGARKMGISLQGVTYDCATLCSVIRALELPGGKKPRQSAAIELIVPHGDDVSLDDVLNFRGNNVAICKSYLRELERASAEPDDAVNHGETYTSGESSLIEKAEAIRKRMRDAYAYPFRWQGIGVVASKDVGRETERQNAPMASLLSNSRLIKELDFPAFSCAYIIPAPTLHI